jgi:hypothetical protein
VCSCVLASFHFWHIASVAVFLGGMHYHDSHICRPCACWHRSCMYVRCPVLIVVPVAQAWQSCMLAACILLVGCLYLLFAAVDVSGM